MIVYLSYSGLGADVERGIDHDALRATFPLLHTRGIPVIHYWRPLMPANSTPEVITQVMDWASRYATCSVSVGLKVKPGARDQMTALWPELGDPALPLESADAIWPRESWEILQTLPNRYPDHPVYQTNSCALAYVLGRHETAGIHGTDTCNGNHCPTAQRDQCARAVPTPLGTPTDAVTNRMQWLGIPVVPISWDDAKRTATVNGPLATRDRNHLAQTLEITVQADRQDGDPYWSGRLGGHQPLVVDS